MTYLNYVTQNDMDNEKEKHPEDCQCAECIHKAIDEAWDLGESRITGN
jgi:hypothetical protein